MILPKLTFNQLPIQAKIACCLHDVYWAVLRATENRISKYSLTACFETFLSKSPCFSKKIKKELNLHILNIYFWNKKKIIEYILALLFCHCPDTLMLSFHA